MRHLLSGLGVLATGVLLIVSATMNWRFGFHLGRTEFDGQIYGAASAAADCMKALVPFFLFAAIRTRQWARATACFVVGSVVTCYSLASALGHAALNRMDTAGHRASASKTYNDNRADLQRIQGQLSWIPQHRPAVTVQSDIDALKTETTWANTAHCTDVKDSGGRSFCQHYHELVAELRSAQQATALEARMVELEAKSSLKGADHAVMSEADPQAAVLASLLAIVMPGVKVEEVQTALTVFVALLLEVGSAFGPYISLGHYTAGETKSRKPCKLTVLDLRGADVLHEVRSTVREIGAPKPDLLTANDQDRDDAATVPNMPQEDKVRRKAVSKAKQQRAANRRAVKRYLDEYTTPAAAARNGTSGDILYRNFAKMELVAGRETQVSLRQFLNLCSLEFRIAKRRLRLPDRKRKVFYALKSVPTA